MISLALSAVAGLLAVRRFAVAAVTYAVVVALGTVATLSDPRGSAGAAVLIGIVAAAASITTLALRVRGRRGASRPVGEDGDRRRFLGLAGAAAAVASVSTAVGRALASAGDVAQAARGVDLPEPDQPAPRNGC